MPRAILSAPVADDDSDAHTSTIKRPFTDEEDAIIIEAVEKSDTQPFAAWSSLAVLKLPGRMGKQIRDRYVNHLNPESKNEKEVTGESKTESKSTSTPPEESENKEQIIKPPLSPAKNADEDGDKTSDSTSDKIDEGEEDESSVSLVKKRKHQQDASLAAESLAKKRKPSESSTHTEAVPISQAMAALLNQQQLQQQFGMPLNPQTMNPQIMNAQISQMMMNAQNSQMMMNPQMMDWGQLPPHLLQGMIPPLGHPNHAANIAAQKMLMMRGGASSGTNPNPMPPTAQDFNCRQLILTLPPPNTKLGILLDNNTTLGMPELKSVAMNSPIRKQIPLQYQKDCCIVSLKSEMIGHLHIQPKTAQECADIIAKSQAGPTQPVTLEIVLVQLKNDSHNPQSEKKKSSRPKTGTCPPRKKGGRKTIDQKVEYNKVNQLALLDFFCDSRKPTVASFIRENQYEESIRSVMRRTINSDKRLSQLVDMRDVAARRKEAYDIILRLIPYSAAEQAEACKEKKAALLCFFSDSSRSTLPTFCYNKNIERKMRGAMGRLIDTSPLSKLVDQRNLPERRKEALVIIEKLFPDNCVQEAAEKAELDRKVKKALFDYFSDSSCSSLALFCEENKLEANMHGSIGRFIDMDKRLSQLVGQRSVAERREEAFNIIEKLLPMVSTPYSNTPGNRQSKDDNSEKEEEKVNSNNPTRYAKAKSKREAWADFFLPANIKIVASKLDFEALPRITRDGSNQIEVHDRKSPDELLMLSIFDLSNRVLRGRALQPKDKEEVMGHCAKILFYDYGYKKVRGATRLDKTWETRLEQAYVSGADTSPLQGHYKGTEAYTEKIEKEHPGILTQLWEYAEESIGKAASFRDKAAFMNEKSLEDAESDPTLPVLKMNKSNLFSWAKGVGKVRLDKAKPHAHGELSLEQIEKKCPSLIEELYNFSVEALGSDASIHMLATCMNERSKEDVEEDPTIPLVLMSKLTLPHWIKKRAKSEHSRVE